MPRIVHVISTPSGMGGAERVVLGLLRAGEERGWQQAVLNPFEREPDRSALAAVCFPATYKGHHCFRMSQVPPSLSWLRRELDRMDPDIVHAHLFHALVAVASLPRVGHSRLVFTHHHGDLYTSANRRVHTLVDRWSGRRFDSVVGVSRWVYRFLTTSYGYPRERVECIPNGWQGSPSGRTGTASRPTVVCVANFRPGKGHDTLLDSFREVLREVPDAQLLLVGGGKLGGILRSRVVDMGLLSSVRFCGSIDDIWPVLEQAHVFVSSSEGEPSGIAVMEAMAAGLPVVAVGVGGITEVVKPGVTGELIRPGDHEEMARQLVALLRSPSRQREMGMAGRKIAESYRVEDMCADYFDLYTRLLDGRRGRSARERVESPATA